MQESLKKCLKSKRKFCFLFVMCRYKVKKSSPLESKSTRNISTIFETLVREVKSTCKLMHVGYSRNGIPGNIYLFKLSNILVQSQQ